jgi:hypothetical protein
MSSGMFTFTVHAGEVKHNFPGASIIGFAQLSQGIFLNRRERLRKGHLSTITATFLPSYRVEYEQELLAVPL